MIFLNALFAMLLLGALHSDYPAVPALGYLTCLAVVALLACIIPTHSVAFSKPRG